MAAGSRGRSSTELREGLQPDGLGFSCVRPCSAGTENMNLPGNRLRHGPAALLGVILVNKTARLFPVFSLVLPALLLGCSDSSDHNGASTPPGPACSMAAPEALRSCIGDVSRTIATCYRDGDRPCDDSDPDIEAALSGLQETVEGACADGELLSLSVDAVVGRLQNACRSQADSIAWRTFGGPQGAVWPGAGDEGRACLQSAHETITGFVDQTLAATNDCLAADACDGTALSEERRSAADEAVASVDTACPELPALIAVDSRTFVSRAEEQVDCTLATVHGDTGDLALSCGPGNVESVPPRGEWSQIILDGEQWGTRCGDGSDYAIQLRLAPEGSPLDRVLIGLQGGGVCLFEEDCTSRLASNPGLFNAQDDLPVSTGIASTDPMNPFSDWTMVYLPYCNQDVFAGGGVVESLGDLELPRYGSINARAGMRVARDILWKLSDEAGGDGFRPDRLIALFGGFSAGGYGALYNYHWVLDDLQWPRTAAFPDAGGALDNGGIGVRTLGFTKIPAWGFRNYLPPYCFSGDCAVGPDLYRATSPRLKQVPEQQYLILSNQKDETQQRDAFFFDEAQWIDAMRAAFCDTKDLRGIQWYLTSDSVNSVHVVSLREEFYYGAVAGEKMVDWLWRAVTDPDSIEDRAEEGNFTTDIPGSSPFPCQLPL